MQRVDRARFPLEEGVEGKLVTDPAHLDPGGSGDKLLAPLLTVRA